MNNLNIYSMLFLCFLLMNSKIAAQDKNVTVLSIENSDKSINLFYEKKNPGNYTLNLVFSNVDNCNVADYEKVISDNSGFIIKLEPVDKNQKITYSMRYYATLGALNPKIDTLYRYTLPFKKGKKIKIFEAEDAAQKYFGEEKSSDWKSYSVLTNNPDTIYSMRKGIVVLINNEYNDNSILDAQYTSRRNQIIIEHTDGTYAMYKGFKKDGIFVKLGQKVNPETELGIIEKYNQSFYRLDFNVHYLSRNFNSQDNKYSYQYFTPIFHTQEGNINIESSKEYTVSKNDNILRQ